MPNTPFQPGASDDPIASPDERCTHEARCSNKLLEHLEHLPETNDLFGNVAKSQNILEQPPWLWTGAPCSPERTWAENGFFKCFHSMHQDACRWLLSVEAAPVFFGPYTLGRGAPSRQVG